MVELAKKGALVSAMEQTEDIYDQTCPICLDDITTSGGTHHRRACKVIQCQKEIIDKSQEDERKTLFFPHLSLKVKVDFSPKYTKSVVLQACLSCGPVEDCSLVSGYTRKGALCTAAFVTFRSSNAVSVLQKQTPKFPILAKAQKLREVLAKSASTSSVDQVQANDSSSATKTAAKPAREPALGIPVHSGELHESFRFLPSVYAVPAQLRPTAVYAVLNPKVDWIGLADLIRPFGRTVGIYRHLSTTCKTEVALVFAQRKSAISLVNDQDAWADKLHFCELSLAESNVDSVLAAPLLIFPVTECLDPQRARLQVILRGVDGDTTYGAVEDFLSRFGSLVSIAPYAEKNNPPKRISVVATYETEKAVDFAAVLAHKAELGTNRVQAFAMSKPRSQHPALLYPALPTPQPDFRWFGSGKHGKFLADLPTVTQPQPVLMPYQCLVCGIPDCATIGELVVPFGPPGPIHNLQRAVFGGAGRKTIQILVTYGSPKDVFAACLLRAEVDGRSVKCTPMMHFEASAEKRKVSPQVSNLDEEASGPSSKAPRLSTQMNENDPDSEAQTSIFKEPFPPASLAERPKGTGTATAATPIVQTSEVKNASDSTVTVDFCKFPKLVFDNLFGSKKVKVSDLPEASDSLLEMSHVLARSIRLEHVTEDTEFLVVLKAIKSVFDDVIVGVYCQKKRSSEDIRFSVVVVFLNPCSPTSGSEEPKLKMGLKEVAIRRCTSDLNLEDPVNKEYPLFVKHLSPCKILEPRMRKSQVLLRKLNDEFLKIKDLAVALQRFGKLETLLVYDANQSNASCLVSFSTERTAMHAAMVIGAACEWHDTTVICPEAIHLSLYDDEKDIALLHPMLQLPAVSMPQYAQRSTPTAHDMRISAKDAPYYLLVTGLGSADPNMTDIFGTNFEVYSLPTHFKHSLLSQTENNLLIREPTPAISFGVCAISESKTGIGRIPLVFISDEFYDFWSLPVQNVSARMDTSDSDATISTVPPWSSNSSHEAVDISMDVEGNAPSNSNQSSFEKAASAKLATTVPNSSARAAQAGSSAVSMRTSIVKTSTDVAGSINAKTDDEVRDCAAVENPIEVVNQRSSPDAKSSAKVAASCIKFQCRVSKLTSTITNDKLAGHLLGCGTACVCRLSDEMAIVGFALEGSLNGALRAGSDRSFKVNGHEVTVEEMKREEYVGPDKGWDPVFLVNCQCAWVLSPEAMARTIIVKQLYSRVTISDLAQKFGSFGEILSIQRYANETKVADGRRLPSALVEYRLLSDVDKATEKNVGIIFFGNPCVIVRASEVGASVKGATPGPRPSPSLPPFAQNNPRTDHAHFSPQVSRNLSTVFGSVSNGKNLPIGFRTTSEIKQYSLRSVSSRLHRRAILLTDVSPTAQLWQILDLMVPILKTRADSVVTIFRTESKNFFVAFCHVGTAEIVLASLTNNTHFMLNGVATAVKGTLCENTGFSKYEENLRLKNLVHSPTLPTRHRNRQLFLEFRKVVGGSLLVSDLLYKLKMFGNVIELQRCDGTLLEPDSYRFVVTYSSEREAMKASFLIHRLQNKEFANLVDSTHLALYNFVNGKSEEHPVWSLPERSICTSRPDLLRNPPLWRTHEKQVSSEDAPYYVKIGPVPLKMVKDVLGDAFHSAQELYAISQSYFVARMKSPKDAFDAVTGGEFLIDKCEPLMFTSDFYYSYWTLPISDSQQEIVAGDIIAAPPSDVHCPPTAPGKQQSSESAPPAVLSSASSTIVAAPNEAQSSKSVQNKPPPLQPMPLNEEQSSENNETQKTRTTKLPLTAPTSRVAASSSSCIAPGKAQCLESDQSASVPPINASNKSQISETAKPAAATTAPSAAGVVSDYAQGQKKDRQALVSTLEKPPGALPTQGVRFDGVNEVTSISHDHAIFTPEIYNNLFANFHVAVPGRDEAQKLPPPIGFWPIAKTPTYVTAVRFGGLAKQLLLRAVVFEGIPKQLPLREVIEKIGPVLLNQGDSIVNTLIKLDPSTPGQDDLVLIFSRPETCDTVLAAQVSGILKLVVNGVEVDLKCSLCVRDRCIKPVPLHFLQTLPSSYADKHYRSRQIVVQSSGKGAVTGLLDELTKFGPVLEVQRCGREKIALLVTYFRERDAMCAAQFLEKRKEGNISFAAHMAFYNFSNHTVVEHPALRLPDETLPVPTAYPLENPQQWKHSLVTSKRSAYFMEIDSGSLVDIRALTALGLAELYKINEKCFIGRFRSPNAVFRAVESSNFTLEHCRPLMFTSDDYYSYWSLPVVSSAESHDADSDLLESPTTRELESAPTSPAAPANSAVNEKQMKTTDEVLSATSASGEGSTVVGKLNLGSIENGERANNVVLPATIMKSGVADSKWSSNDTAEISRILKNCSDIDSHVANLPVFPFIPNGIAVELYDVPHTTLIADVLKHLAYLQLMPILGLYRYTIPRHIVVVFPSGSAVKRALLAILNACSEGRWDVRSKFVGKPPEKVARTRMADVPAYGSLDPSFSSQRLLLKYSNRNMPIGELIATLGKFGRVLTIQKLATKTGLPMRAVTYESANEALKAALSLRLTDSLLVGYEPLFNLSNCCFDVHAIELLPTLADSSVIGRGALVLTKDLPSLDPSTCIDSPYFLCIGPSKRAVAVATKLLSLKYGPFHGAFKISYNGVALAVIKLKSPRRVLEACMDENFDRGLLVPMMFVTGASVAYEKIQVVPPEANSEDSSAKICDVVDLERENNQIVVKTETRLSPPLPSLDKISAECVRFQCRVTNLTSAISNVELAERFVFCGTAAVRRLSNEEAILGFSREQSSVWAAKATATPTAILKGRQLKIESVRSENVFQADAEWEPVFLVNCESFALVSPEAMDRTVIVRNVVRKVTVFALRQRLGEFGNILSVRKVDEAELAYRSSLPVAAAIEFECTASVQKAVENHLVTLSGLPWLVVPVRGAEKAETKAADRSRQPKPVCGTSAAFNEFLPSTSSCSWPPGGVPPLSQTQNKTSCSTSIGQLAPRIVTANSVLSIRQKTTPSAISQPTAAIPVTTLNLASSLMYTPPIPIAQPLAFDLPFPVPPPIRHPTQLPSIPTTLPPVTDMPFTTNRVPQILETARFQQPAPDARFPPRFAAPAVAKPTPAFQPPPMGLPPVSIQQLGAPSGSTAVSDVPYYHRDGCPPYQLRSHHEVQPEVSANSAVVNRKRHVLNEFEVAFASLEKWYILQFLPSMPSCSWPASNVPPPQKRPCVGPTAEPQASVPMEIDEIALPPGPPPYPVCATQTENPLLLADVIYEFRKTVRGILAKSDSGFEVLAKTNQELTANPKISASVSKLACALADKCEPDLRHAISEHLVAWFAAKFLLPRRITVAADEDAAASEALTYAQLQSESAALEADHEAEIQSVSKNISDLDAELKTAETDGRSSCDADTKKIEKLSDSIKQSEADMILLESEVELELLSNRQEVERAKVRLERLKQKIKDAESDHEGRRAVAQTYRELQETYDELLSDSCHLNDSVDRLRPEVGKPFSRSTIFDGEIAVLKKALKEIAETNSVLSGKIVLLDTELETVQAKASTAEVTEAQRAVAEKETEITAELNQLELLLAATESIFGSGSSAKKRGRPTQEECASTAHVLITQVSEFGRLFMESWQEYLHGMEQIASLERVVPEVSDIIAAKENKIAELTAAIANTRETIDSFSQSAETEIRRLENLVVINALSRR